MFLREGGGTSGYTAWATDQPDRPESVYTIGVQVDETDADTGLFVDGEAATWYPLCQTPARTAGK